MNRLIVFLLFVLTVSNSSASVLDQIIEEECSGVPSWVVKKVITHESKTFFNGKAQPWPWTLNIDGVGHYFEDYVSALVAARVALDSSDNIDIGIAQISWKYHAHRFDDKLANALDPRRNIYAACRILREGKSNKNRVITWEDAIAYYHRPVLDSKARKYAQTVLGL